jgi:hypothetical protein
MRSTPSGKRSAVSLTSSVDADTTMPLLELLHEAVSVYRKLEDPWQLAGLLVDLAALEAAMGRGTEALHTLAESSRIEDQIGRRPGRSYRLAIGAVVHL